MEGVMEYMITTGNLPTKLSGNHILLIYHYILNSRKSNLIIFKSWDGLLSACIAEIELYDLVDPIRLENLKKQYNEKVKRNLHLGWEAYETNISDVQPRLDKITMIEGEIHPSLNTISVQEINDFDSPKFIWWNCQNKHIYREKISARLVDKKGCPICKLDQNKLPQNFWRGIYPGFYSAKIVILSFMLTFHIIPSTMETKIISKVNAALRNKNIAGSWGIKNWSELLISVIDNFPLDVTDRPLILSKVIESYNITALNLKHKGWMPISSQ